MQGSSSEGAQVRELKRGSSSKGAQAREPKQGSPSKVGESNQAIRQADKQALGGHSVGAMPWRGLL